MRNGNADLHNARIKHASGAGNGPIQGGTFQSFPIPQEGGCNIPTSAAAYSLNVSVVPQGPLGYLTIWPTGEGRPVVATLNSIDGRIKADAAIVPAGDQGVTLTGDDIVGLPGALLEAGARSVVVSIPAARDDAAMQFMTVYHDHRVEGLPPHWMQAHVSRLKLASQRASPAAGMAMPLRRDLTPRHMRLERL